jgi:anti-sigma factor RsiW
MAEANLVTAIASEREPHVHNAEGCVHVIQRMRCARELAAIQNEIDRLQERGAAEHADEMDALLMRKRQLLQQMEALSEN